MNGLDLGLGTSYCLGSITFIMQTRVVIIICYLLLFYYYVQDHTHVHGLISKKINNNRQKIKSTLARMTYRILIVYAGVSLYIQCNQKH